MAKKKKSLPLEKKDVGEQLRVAGLAPTTPAITDKLCALVTSTTKETTIAVKLHALKSLLEAETIPASRLASVRKAFAVAAAHPNPEVKTAGLTGLSRMPDAAVDAFESITFSFVSEKDKVSVAAGLATVAALQSETHWAPCWDAWARLTLASPNKEVAEAALALIPTQDFFASLPADQKASWVQRRKSIETPAQTSNELSLLRRIVEDKDYAAELKGLALEALGHAMVSDDSDEAQLVSLLDGILAHPQTNVSLRGSAAFALGKRRAASVSSLSLLFELAKSGDKPLDHAATVAIARIVTAPGLPTDFAFPYRFAAEDSLDWRVAVASVILASDNVEARVAIADGIEGHPVRFGGLKGKLQWLKDHAGDAKASHYKAAADSLP